MANTTRMSMLAIISSCNKGEIIITASQLTEMINIEQGICSHHLSILKNAGLVKVKNITLDSKNNKSLTIGNNEINHLIQSLQFLLTER